MNQNKKLILAAGAAGVLVLSFVYWIFSDDLSSPSPVNDQAVINNFSKNFSMTVPKDEHIDPSLSRDEYLEAEENQKLATVARDQRNKERRQSDRLGTADLDWTSPKSSVADKKEEVRYVEKKPTPKKKIGGSRRRSRPVASPSQSVASPSPTPAPPTPSRRRGLSIIEKEGSSMVSSDKYLAETYEGINFRGGATTVRIRFAQSFEINTCEVKANQLYPARIIGSSGDRLLINLSINCPKSRISFSAFDNDGQEGLFMEELSVNKELGNEVAADAVQEGADRLGQAIGGTVPLVGGVVSKIIGSRNKRVNSIYLPEGKKLNFIMKK